jgi:DNA-binding MarR family transcriptional regulator
MNKMVELVNRFAEFEETHPAAGMEDFCRHYIASQQNKETLENLFGGEKPPRADIILTKLLDRISRIHMIYIHIAMKGMEIQHFEEFSLLSAIANLKNPRKTEVIYHTINELSTGLNLLAAMKKRRYINEQEDPEDKRSKRLSLTPKGKKILEDCYKRFSEIPKLLFMDIDNEDILLCIQVLKNIDLKFAKIWQHDKGKSLEEITKSKNMLEK